MKEIWSMVGQILQGLKEVHELGISHWDLKPENVLMNDEGIIKICDFGSAKVIDKTGKNTPYIVSRYYWAPELISNAKLINCSFQGVIGIDVIFIHAQLEGSGASYGMVIDVIFQDTA